jgi:hypothetical protein
VKLMQADGLVARGRMVLAREEIERLACVAHPQHPHGLGVHFRAVPTFGSVTQDDQRMPSTRTTKPGFGAALSVSRPEGKVRGGFKPLRGPGRGGSATSRLRLSRADKARVQDASPYDSYSRPVLARPRGSIRCPHLLALADSHLVLWGCWLQRSASRWHPPKCRWPDWGG